MLVLEAMKMQNSMVTGKAGVVRKLAFYLFFFIHNILQKKKFADVPCYCRVYVKRISIRL